MPGGKRRPAAGDVLAGEPPVRPRLEPGRQHDRVAGRADILLHENRVETRRQRRASEDPHRAALRHGTLERGAGRNPPDDREHGLAARDEIGEAHRVPVDGGVVEGRQVEGRRDVLGQHAPVGLDERHVFDGGGDRDTLGDQRLRLVDGHELAAEGEAVIRELRHGRDPVGAAARRSRAPRPCRRARPDDAGRRAGGGERRDDARERLGKRERRVGDGADVVERQDRDGGVRDRAIGRDGAHVRHLGEEEGLVVLCAVNLDLRMGGGLEALDDDEVDGGEAREEFGEAGLRLGPQLMHQGPAPLGGDQHLPGARGPVLERVLAGLVDLEGVMGVLDRRDRDAALGELRDEPEEKGRLPRPAPPGKTDHAHGFR